MKNEECRAQKRTLATSMDGKTSHEYCELEMIYQVKRLGLVRIMEDMHTITSVYLVC